MKRNGKNKELNTDFIFHLFVYLIETYYADIENVCDNKLKVQETSLDMKPDVVFKKHRWLCKLNTSVLGSIHMSWLINKSKSNSYIIKLLKATKCAFFETCLHSVWNSDHDETKHHCSRMFSHMFTRIAKVLSYYDVMKKIAQQVQRWIFFPLSIWPMLMESAKSF